VLKAGTVGDGSSVFPAPEKDDEPWEHRPVPSFGNIQMRVCLGSWIWFDVVWVQFITCSSFLSRFGELQVPVWEQICDPLKSSIFSV